MVTEIIEVPIEQIVKSPYQPRIELNPLETLSSPEDLQQALVTRRVNGKFELVDGEGRLERLRRLGAKTIRCEVREMTDKEASVAVLRINDERKLLESVDRANWLANRMKTFGETLTEAAAAAHWPKQTASSLYELARLKGWVIDSTYEPVPSRDAEDGSRNKPLTRNKVSIISALPQQKRRQVAKVVEEKKVSTADLKVVVAKVRAGKTAEQALTEVENFKDSQKQEAHQNLRAREGKKSAPHRNYTFCEDCGDQLFFVHSGTQEHRFLKGEKTT